jgi:hypothetical protein
MVEPIRGEQAIFVEPACLPCEIEERETLAVLQQSINGVCKLNFHLLRVLRGYPYNKTD